MKDKTLKKKKDVFRKVILFILGLIIVFLLFSFIRHKILLAREEALITPSGQMINVDGHKMHVYSVGDGDKTLILMSANGTVCPSLDFKNLFAKVNSTFYSF